MTAATKRVLVAPDKFAGTLTAHDAAQAMSSGWSSVRPNDVVDRCPLTDGGPGFLDVVAANVAGAASTTMATGPDGTPVSARLVRCDEGGRRTIYLEAADVCGLHLAPSPREPMAMTTAGVADLLAAAVGAGADRVVVGVGGTASTDGGAGMVRRWAGHYGAWPATIDLVGAVDVLVPLLGDGGAAHGFARQKGATDVDVERLEQQLIGWASTSAGDPDRPGAGAGGGLGFGLALLGGRLESGGALVARLVDLPARARASAVVLTGEGRLDPTSLVGEVVGVVAAAHPRPPTWARVGADALPPQLRHQAGLRVASLTERFGDQAARTAPAVRLAELAAELAADLSADPSSDLSADFSADPDLPAPPGQPFVRSPDPPG